MQWRTPIWKFHGTAQRLLSNLLFTLVWCSLKVALTLVWFNWEKQENWTDIWINWRKWICETQLHLKDIKYLGDVVVFAICDIIKELYIMRNTKHFLYVVYC